MTRPKGERAAQREGKQVAVWLRTEIKDALAARAQAAGTSQKAVIEAALQHYLETPPLPSPSAPT